MPCILKAIVGWVILLVASGMIGLFLRRGLFGVLVPFPAASTNPAVEQALQSTRKSFKRAHIANTIFSFLVTAAYLWALFHFWNIALAATGLLMMIVVVVHYAQTPRFVSLAADALLWVSSVLVWYSLCK
jgi:carbon starvation protein CstA